MNKYHYNREQLEAFKQMAAWRNNPKELFYSTRKWSAGDSAFWGHFLGVVGEYTIARETKGFFDPMPLIEGDRHSADVVFPSGRGISVKTTRHSPPIFKINNERELAKSTDVALCHYGKSCCSVIWIKEKDWFFENCYRRDFGYGERICC